jgi:hypothetical protein
MKNSRTNNTKKCDKEKQRPTYKPKPKQEQMEYKEPEIHYEEGIPYICYGNTPYALDDDLKTIDYALTKVLREILDKKM